MTGPALPGRVAIPATVPSGGGVVYGGACYVAGWAFRESTGAASATFNLIDGSDANGAMVVPFSLAAGESTRDLTGDMPIAFKAGAFVQVLAGSVTGTVFVSDVRGALDT